MIDNPLHADTDTPFIESNDDRLTVRITGRRLFLGTLAALFSIKLLSTLSTLGVEVPLLREFLAVVFLTFVPGLFALLQFDYHERSLTSTVSYAVGLSLLLVMTIGGAASLGFPRIGLEQPLSLDMLLMTGAVLGGIAAASSSSTLSLRLEKRWFSDPVLLTLLLLPFISILGSVRYETSGNNLVLLGLLVTISVIPIIFVSRGGEAWYFPVAIWCISLALLYHGRVPGYYTVTQPLPQVTLEHLRWIPNYENGLGSLLANGVLFPVYAILTGLPIEIEWNLVNPILVSFLPVTLYETFRRYVPKRDALLSASLFAFAYPFYVLYPGAGRAATPVIFLALLGLAYSDDSLPSKVRQLFLIGFGIGVAVSHYGTAYVVMFALFVGVAAFVVLKGLLQADLQTRLGRVQVEVPDGGSKLPDRNIQFPSVLRPTYITYYSVFALSWYLYTADSVKFEVLPRKVISAAQGVLYFEATGSTVSSYQQDYASLAITLGKYLYVVFGLLMAIGIAVAVFKLVVYREETIETGYLAIAIGFFSMFVGSALPSGNGFAVARVMMIIFAFAVPFVVIGAREVGSGGQWVLRKTFQLESKLPSRTALSLVLALFLLLNTGVVSETVTHDTAPSNRISQERLLNSDDPDLRLRVRDCVRCDVQTHVWVGNRIPKGQTPHAGIITDNQRDYYRGTIAERTSRSFRYEQVTANQTGIPRGNYVALLQHNRELSGFSIGYKFEFYRKDMSAYTSGSRLYSNGKSVVYYEDQIGNWTV